MRLRRWAVKGYVPDGPQYNDQFKPFHACWTKNGAEHEAEGLNSMAAFYGYKIRFKVVRL
jgi:hypothetical protein